MMKILFLISGHSTPSARFRVLAFVPHLERLGHTCHVRASFPEKYGSIPAIGWRPSQKLKRAVRMLHFLEARLKRYDVVVIERGLFHDNTFSMEQRFRRVAKSLVLDVDDAVFVHFPEKFHEIARMSDLVIAGNHLLQEYVRPINSSVVVIPTCVDLAQYTPRLRPEGSQRPVVGWIGTTSNLQYIGLIAPALRRLAARCDFELRLIAGDDRPLESMDLSGITVRFITWNGATEVDELRRFDIGLMPLFPDRPWDKYKCGLKLIQYMAVAIPGVASPVGVNTKIVQSGRNGFLAETYEQWESILFQLLNDRQRREEIGAAARETVVEHYSIQANLPLFVASLESACRKESASAARRP